MTEVGKIIVEIKEHFKADYKLSVYAYAIAFTSIGVIFTYFFHFDQKVIFKNFGTNRGIIDIMIFYLFSYFAALIPILVLKNKTEILKSTEFWVKTLLVILLFGFLTGFSKSDNLAIAIGKNQYEQYYLANIFAFTKKIIPLLIFMYFIKNKYDKKDANFYGFSSKGLKLSPYFLFLLLILPFVVLVSFLPDFLSYYPRFKFWLFPEIFGLNSFFQTVFFELSYAVSFISTEFFFRGVLVISLAKILKKDAVLAMAVFYCFSHFGKPAGEAISALFGGYILGVIALNHKNINGGIIVHIGIAMLMEIISMLQYVSKL